MGLLNKGVRKVIQRFINKTYENMDHLSLQAIVKEYVNYIFDLDLNECKLEFIDNEPINDDFILYRYHLKCSRKREYIGARVVTRKNELMMLAFTIGTEYEEFIKPSLLENKEKRVLLTEQQYTT